MNKYTETTLTGRFVTRKDKTDSCALPDPGLVLPRVVHKIGNNYIRPKRLSQLYF